MELVIIIVNSDKQEPAQACASQRLSANRMSGTRYALYTYGYNTNTITAPQNESDNRVLHKIGHKTVKIGHETVMIGHKTVILRSVIKP